MECKIERLIKDGDRVAGAFGYWRNTGKFVLFKAKAVVLATGGIGKAWKFTSNSWEYTGDGHSLAVWAGADLIDMEFVQFHPTGMVWPPSVRGILVTEGVRGDGGTLKNTNGERFMFNYIPEFFKGETADSRGRGRPLVRGQEEQPPHPRPAAARRGGAGDQLGGEGGPGHARTAACSSTSHPRATADYIRKRLPSMYHQFKELAGVDITKEPMEVGPTCHYVMGGVRVDADSTAATVPGLFAAGEVGGRPARQQPARRQLAWATCWSSAGARACTPRSTPRTWAGSSQGRRGRRWSQIVRGRCSSPSRATGGENPYAIQSDLQETMQNLVGIIRTEAELKEALQKLEALKDRAKRVRVEGGRIYNPGWHTALDLALAPDRLGVLRHRGAGAQGEPRRPHPRRPSRTRTTPGARSTWCCASEGGPDGAAARAAAPDAARAQGPPPGEEVMADLHDAGVPRQPRGRRLQGVQGRGR